MKIFLLSNKNILNNSNVTFTNSVEEFYDIFLDRYYDLLIADFDFYKDVKEFINIYNGYIIFLCKNCDESKYKSSLEIADFCYSYTELFKLNYRIEYLKRKVFKSRDSIFKYKDLIYNFNTSSLYKNGELIKLTKAQLELISLLIKNRNHFLSSEQIVNISSFIGSISSIKVLISSLRKLGFDIISKQNLGYKLNTN